MARIHPFRALRPEPGAARAVAAVPYDVVTAAEARALAAGNPLSFLHVSRAEIDLPPETDPYAEAVYRTAAANLERLRREAPLVVEAAPSLYVYRMQAADHEQTGLAACWSVDEYDRGAIRRHETTRADKEDDRTRHMLAVQAQTGIVALTYRARPEITALTRRAAQAAPLLDVAADDGVRHSVWRLEAAAQAEAEAAFARVPELYIADGHHRVASAARARDERAVATGEPGRARFVLGVAFPDSETRILAYNRTVADLAEHTPASFLRALRARFAVRSGAPAEPPRGHVAIYLGAGAWHDVELPPAPAAAVDPAAGLDAAVLQEALLEPLLRVRDVRTDPRVGFVGGARGTEALERLVDSGPAAAAFSLAPVTTADLFAVSDGGRMMPPKSTWFEPKLRDGLLIHPL